MERLTDLMQDAAPLPSMQLLRKSKTTAPQQRSCYLVRFPPEQPELYRASEPP
ncbi:hypothetical protein KNP414_05166 [Paenibacillus mucilaginosus KNP414]|uniref:Uncharacterized protein n=1 Tax=Paenibacillus mucilaginosus (strain KNP414) TaxID=1036673 RepID=F8F9K1_PAEMK|nr:hypothetical protein KNP414_05166 [Paenibacillus mucilaginosus KNP414]